MKTGTAPRKKNLLEPVFSVNYLPAHKLHYKSQATPGIRTRRNELLQVESHSVAPDHVPGQSEAGGVLTPRSGDAPTVGDWETVGSKGRTGQETVPEPA